jgi:hypothetical protein
LQKAPKAKSKTITEPQIDSRNSCFDLDCSGTGPYIDPFLPDNDQYDVQHLDDISSYLGSEISTDISKENPDISLCLDSFMQQSFFEMTNINDFATPIDNSLSSRSQSSYALSPEALQLSAGTNFPMTNEVASSSASVVTSDSADGPFPALEAWPLFQCNHVMSATSCPTTARSHLKNLYSSLSNQNLSLDSCGLTDHVAPIEPLLAGTRDRLIAIMQVFSNRTRKIHGLISSTDENSMIEPNAPFFLVLPLPHVLESLLHACLGCYEPYYPFLSAASLKTNKLMERGDNAVISSLKLLLMLAAGALTTGTGDIYQMAHGLLEICRVSLSYLIEEDIKLVSSPDVLQCALLFTIVAAWSGDKWQMDVCVSPHTFAE